MTVSDQLSLDARTVSCGRVLLRLCRRASVTAYECIRAPHDGGEHIFYPITRERPSETVVVGGGAL